MIALRPTQPPALHSLSLFLFTPLYSQALGTIASGWELKQGSHEQLCRLCAMHSLWSTKHNGDGGNIRTQSILGPKSFPGKLRSRLELSAEAHRKGGGSLTGDGPELQERGKLWLSQGPSLELKIACLQPETLSANSDTSTLCL